MEYSEIDKLKDANHELSIRAELAEAERDQLRQRLAQLEQAQRTAVAYGEGWQQRAEQAESEGAALRTQLTALRTIRDSLLEHLAWLRAQLAAQKSCTWIETESANAFLLAEEGEKKER